MKKADLRVGMILKTSYGIYADRPYFLVLTTGKTGWSALSSAKLDYFWISIDAKELQVIGHGHWCWQDLKYFKPVEK